MKRFLSIFTLCLPLIACNAQLEEQGLLQKHGEWTFVNYWAEWCKPCIEEIPELNAMHQREGYRVLGVNFDGASGEELQSQLTALGVHFPTLDEDPSDTFSIDRPQVLPTTLLVSPEGRLLRTLVGPQTEETLIAATEGHSGQE